MQLKITVSSNKFLMKKLLILNNIDFLSVYNKQNLDSTKDMPIKESLIHFITKKNGFLWTVLEFFSYKILEIVNSIVCINAVAIKMDAH